MPVQLGFGIMDEGFFSCQTVATMCVSNSYHLHILSCFMFTPLRQLGILSCKYFYLATVSISNVWGWGGVEARQIAPRRAVGMRLCRAFHESNFEIGQCDIFNVCVSRDETQTAPAKNIAGAACF